MRNKAEVDKIKVDSGKVYVKWKGGSKYLLIEDKEIAIAFMFIYESYQTIVHPEYWSLESDTVREKFIDGDIDAKTEKGEELRCIVSKLQEVAYEPLTENNDPEWLKEQAMAEEIAKYIAEGIASGKLPISSNYLA